MMLHTSILWFGPRKLGYKKVHNLYLSHEKEKQSKSSMEDAGHASQKGKG